MCSPWPLLLGICGALRQFFVFEKVHFPAYVSGSVSSHCKCNETISMFTNGTFSERPRMRQELSINVETQTRDIDREGGCQSKPANRVGAALTGSVATVNVTKFSTCFQLTVPFPSNHEGFKSSRLDSYSKLGVVAVGFQTAPLEAFEVAGKRYRKFSVVGVS
jgi:hypothetical protein